MYASCCVGVHLLWFAVRGGCCRRLLPSPKEGNFLFLGGARWGSWPLSQSPEPADPDRGAARQPDIRDGGRSLSGPRPDDPVSCIAQAGGSDCVFSAGGRDSWWCWPGLRAPGVRSRAAAVLYYASAVDGCQPPGAVLPARWSWGAPLAWSHWSWLLLCQQAAGMLDWGGSGALYQVLVQQPLLLCM